jgi:hypothetical protein
MEENKYYVPTLEEFHPGFSYEAYNSNEWFFAEAGSGWFKQTWEPRRPALEMQAVNIEYAIRKGWIKVKFLDNEDIGAEGFDEEFNEYGDVIFFDKNTFRLVINPDKSITIKESYKYIRRGNNYIGFNTLFEGEIKNKSEFQRILKMIGV